MRTSLPLVIALVSGGAALHAEAAQVVLTPGAVIGDTGSYTFPLGTTSRPGALPAGGILDDQIGVIPAETFLTGYWINGNNGPSNPYITVDLGAAYSSLSFQLFNSSNGFIGDRGTGDFTLVAGNAVVTDGANGFMLSGPVTTLVSGTLSAQSPTGPITAQAFTSTSSAAYRYIEFLPTSVASAVPIDGGITNNYGLDELRIFSGVPEPESWTLMLIGFGGLGAAMRSRRRATVPA